MASDYKIATRVLTIGNANAYGPGDRVHKQVIDDHFSGDDYSDAFMADTEANQAKIAEQNAPAGPQPANAATNAPSGK